MLSYQKLKKMLSNWEGSVVGITVKPSLYQIIVRDYMPNSFPVYPHQYQKEDICIFYDHRSLQQHLRLAEENKGFTVVPQKGFDVTAALKERGEWHEEWRIRRSRERSGAGGIHQKALARLHSARVAQSRRRAALPRAAARSRPLQGTLSRMKRQLGFMFRILFWDAVMICVLVFAFTYAHAQNEQITVGSYELGRGIIAPDALAIIHGGAFTFESKQVSMFDSLTEIGGVQVWIGGKERGQLAQLRYVGYDTISFVMPSASSLQQLGWQQVEVSAPLGQYSALVFIAPVSAEIFTNHCIDSPSCINRMPFGLAWVNNSIVIPTLNEPIPNNNTQVSLFGTGLRRSARILVWITDELDGLAVVEGSVAPHSFFIGWDVVSFPLPATIQRDGREVPLRGKITVQLAAAQPSPMRWWSFANSIELTVME